MCDAITKNDCTADCTAVWGGKKKNDRCTVCDGKDNCLDCKKVVNGKSRLDECGKCDANLTNNCRQDCKQVWGGSATKDACGACDGPGKKTCGAGAGMHCGVCPTVYESTLSASMADVQSDLPGFKSKFKRGLAGVLGVNETRFKITAVRAGSVVVAWYITPLPTNPPAGAKSAGQLGTDFATKAKAAGAAGIAIGDYKQLEYKSVDSGDTSTTPSPTASPTVGSKAPEKKGGVSGVVIALLIIAAIALLAWAYWQQTKTKDGGKDAHDASGEEEGLYGGGSMEANPASAGSQPKKGDAKLHLSTWGKDANPMHESSDDDDDLPIAMLTAAARPTQTPVSAS